MVTEDVVRVIMPGGIAPIYLVPSVIDFAVHL
jgi:hypothetical protein